MHLISARVVFRGVIVAALLPVFIPVCRAQFNADYQTNIISGVVSNWAGNYIVGSNTFADVLLIQNVGVLSNGLSYVGYEASSSNNSVWVTDSGSVWRNVSVIRIGTGGSGNSLVISNGAQVVGSHVHLGETSGSYNNSALLTGSGSVWKITSTLRIGNAVRCQSSITLAAIARRVESCASKSDEYFDPTGFTKSQPREGQKSEPTRQSGRMSFYIVQGTQRARKSTQDYATAMDKDSDYSLASAAHRMLQTQLFTPGKISDEGDIAVTRVL